MWVCSMIHVFFSFQHPNSFTVYFCLLCPIQKFSLVFFLYRAVFSRTKFKLKLENLVFYVCVSNIMAAELLYQFPSILSVWKSDWVICVWNVIIFCWCLSLCKMPSKMNKCIIIQMYVCVWMCVSVQMCVCLCVCTARWIQEQFLPPRKRVIKWFFRYFFSAQVVSMVVHLCLMRVI